MPITKGAKKTLRSSARKRVFNLRRKREMSEAVKNLRKAVDGNMESDAKELLPKAYKAIDKAAKRGIIKKNTASRKKSRVAALAKSIGK